MVNEQLHAEAASSATRTGRVDHNVMKANNAGLVLRHLRAHGGQPRASLSAQTGLSRATMSTLIGDLVQLGLVREEGPDRKGSVGRPGLLVSLDGAHVAGMGVELNLDYVALAVVNLQGVPTYQATERFRTDQASPREVLDRVGRMIRSAYDATVASGARVVSLTVAPPGVIDYAAGTVIFAPNLGWRDVRLRDELARRLAPLDLPIHLENDAKVAALAAYTSQNQPVAQDLLVLTGNFGVGAGIVCGGQVVRGWSGFSGEVGHLHLDPQNRQCRCGRTGCWELAVGVGAFLDLALDADDPLADPAMPLDDKLPVLAQRAAAGDERTLAALATVTELLAKGLSLLIDVLNPQVVELDGYFSYFGDELLPQLATLLAARRMDEGSRVELQVGEPGVHAAARGAALMAVEDVFRNPWILEA